MSLNEIGYWRGVLVVESDKRLAGFVGHQVLIPEIAKNLDMRV
jgi:hypothetical protein